MRIGPRACLGFDLVMVILNGLGAEVQKLGDLFGRSTRGDEPQYLRLARAQLVD